MARPEAKIAMISNLKLLLLSAWLANYAVSFEIPMRTTGKSSSAFRSDITTFLKLQGHPVEPRRIQSGFEQADGLNTESIPAREANLLCVSNSLQGNDLNMLSAELSFHSEATQSSFTETVLRSAVKALCWRLVAASITFITTLRFSGSAITALQVVTADFFSKALTMFIGERLMNRSQAGRHSGSDAASRSMVKALIWRLFAVCNTLTLAVLVSKNVSIASKIASTDALFKTSLMFGYERAWAYISWGKEYFKESSSQQHRQLIRQPLGHWQPAMAILGKLPRYRYVLNCDRGSLQNYII